MEFTGRRLSERLLAGLLAIFVALYFFSDIMGPVSAEGETPVPPGGYTQTGYIQPMKVEEVTVTINGSQITPGGAVNRFNDGDQFELLFKWTLQNGLTYAGQTYLYDLTQDLKGLILPSEGISMSIDYTGDTHEDFFYDVYTQNIGGEDHIIMKLRFGETEDVSNYKGTFSISGTISVDNLQLGSNKNSEIKFADKSFTISPNSAHPYLNLNKEPVDGMFTTADSENNLTYYQKFRVTVNNPSGVDATNVVLTDTYGELFTSAPFSDVTLAVSPASVGSPASFGGDGKLTIGTIPAGGSAVLEYTMKLDRNNVVNKNGSWNNAEAKGDDDAYANDREWLDYTAPSVSKKGKLSGGNIEWTVTVDMGVMKDESFTVRDIPGENIDAAELAAALGVDVNLDGSVTIPLEKMTDNGNGKYSITYSVKAPTADEFLNKTAKNSVKVDIPGTPGINSDAEVTIPPSGASGEGITKEHTVNGNKLTWTIKATVPNAALTSLVFTDKIDDDWAYDGSKIDIDYSTFTVTENNGTQHHITDTPPVTVGGVGSLNRYTYKPNSNFELTVTDADFLQRNKGKEITISYDMTIDVAKVPRVKNNVDMSAYLSTGKMPTVSAESEYLKPLAVTKEQDWGETGTYGRASRTWRVALANNSKIFKAGDVIVFKDTLPKGYMLQTESLKVSTGDRTTGAVTFTYSVPDPWSDTAENEFTVSVPVTTAEFADYLNNTSNNLYFYYTANMTEARYESFNNHQASENYRESLTNKAEISVVRGGAEIAKDDAEYKFDISAPYEHFLDKGITSQKKVSYGNGKQGFEAEYRIEINRTLPRASIGSGQTITVTDVLGSALTYVDGSLEILSYDNDNDYYPTYPETNNVPWSYNATSKTFTFTLKNGKYYTITYKVKGSDSDMLFRDELTYNDPSDPDYSAEIQKELERRFGNTVTITAPDSSGYEAKAELDSKTFRKSSSYEHHIMIQGTKSWPDSASADADEIIIQVTQYEKRVGTNNEPGDDPVSATYKYHLLNKSESETIPDDTATGIYRRITKNGNKWAFRIDNLRVRDAVMGIDYYYSIEELTESGATGFVPSYTNADGDDIPAIASYFVGLNKLSGTVNISNTKDTIETGKTKLSFRKTGKVDNATVILGGAEFELTTDDGDLSGDGVISYAEIINTPTKGKLEFRTIDGQNVVFELPDGTYTLKETKAPDGFKPDETDCTITVASPDVTVTNTAPFSFNKPGGIATVTMTDAGNVIYLRKTDNPNRVAGAVMKLVPADDNDADLSYMTIGGAAAVKRYTDAATGKTVFEFETGSSDVAFKNIPQGKYIISETRAPAGYLKEQKSYTFEVKADGKVYQAGGNVNNYSIVEANTVVRLENKFKPIYIHKVSDVNGTLTSKRIANATFKITRASGNTANLSNVKVSNTATTPVITVDSVTFATHPDYRTEIRRLPAGNYKMEEVSPAPGHFPMGDIYFTVDFNKNVTITSKDANDDIYTDSYNNCAVIAVEDVSMKFELSKILVNGSTSSRPGGIKLQIARDTDNTADLKAAGTYVENATVETETTVVDGKTVVNYLYVETDKITFTTIENKDALIGRLPEGKYIITELEVPSTVQKAADTKFEIKNGKVSVVEGAALTVSTDTTANAGKLVLANAPKGAVLFSKKFTTPDGTETVSEKQYKSVKFTLTDTKDNSATENITSDEYGNVSITGLNDGTYIIEEKTPTPPGNSSKASDKKLKCVISGGSVKYYWNDGTDDTAITGTPEFENKLTYAAIAKTDMSGEEQVSGATLEITSADGLVEFDGDLVFVRDADGNAYDGWSFSADNKTISFTTTDGDNTAYIIGLPEGAYKLTEYSAPAGFNIAPEFYFSITAADGITATNDKFHTLSDDGTEKITVMDSINGFGVKKLSGGAVIAGASFEITRADGNTEDMSSASLSAPGCADEFSAAEDKITFVTKAETAKIKGLPAGDYILKETGAPAGFKAVNTPFAFTMNTDGTIKQTDSAAVFPAHSIAGSTNIISVQNDAYKAAVSKENAGGKQIAGAQLKLTCTDDTVDLSKIKVQYADGTAHTFAYGDGAVTLVTTSDKTDNTAYFIGLPADKTYILEEEIAPNGYKAVSRFKFKLNADGSVAPDGEAPASHSVNGNVITVVNDLTSVAINKTDMSGSAQIPGATLTITTEGSLSLFDNVHVGGITGGVTKNKSGTSISLSFVTGSSIAEITGLPAGSYKLTETSAPDGYTVADTFFFTIERDGKVKPTAGMDNGDNNSVSKSGGKYIIRIVDKPLSSSTETSAGDHTAQTTGGIFHPSGPSNTTYTPSTVNPPTTVPAASTTAPEVITDEPATSPAEPSADETTAKTKKTSGSKHTTKAEDSSDMGSGAVTDDSGSTPNGDDLITSDESNPYTGTPSLTLTLALGFAFTAVTTGGRKKSEK